MGQLTLMAHDEDSSESGPIEHHEPVSKGAIARLVVAGIVLILIVVFCVQNTDSTPVDFFGRHPEPPLFVVIALSGVAGALLGALASWRRHRRQRV
jgi:uncharacterized integral membrane protein